MKVYATGNVRAWARKADVTDDMLYKAAEEVGDGLVDADLGSGLCKKRLATNTGQGKSGGARTLLAFNNGDRVVYVFGFKKNQIDNVAKEALKTYRRLAKIYNAYTEDEISRAVKERQLFEIKKTKIQK